MDFKPIKTKKIYEEIVEQIKEMISKGELNPGDKLMPERELAERLQVGRSAVREAYRALEAIGIIQIRSGEGTFVREVGTKSMTDIMSLVLMTEKNALCELLELRRIIEVSAAGLAAERRTEEDLANLKKYLDQMKLDIDSGHLGELADMKFHYAVTDAAHNSLLMRFMNTISETMETLLRTARKQLYNTVGTPERLYHEHVEVFKAIVLGNSEEAKNKMLEHLNMVEQNLNLNCVDNHCKIN